jgi:Protein of Unknown function (DUF2784)
MYGILADAVVFVHVAYVAFIVLGQVAIIIGAGLQWNWVRNPWFRGLHLLMIAIVVLEVFMGWNCPLTTWENDLRQLAGQTVAEGTFVGRMMHSLLFLDESWPPRAIQVLHVAFGGLVLQALLMCPPRLKRSTPRCESGILSIA